MDDLKLLKILRRETPPMTAAAAQTARARLLAAATAEPPGTRPWRSALRNGLSRAAWRVAIAATLGVALTATATVTRDLDVDPQRPQQARSSAGLLPAGVANAAELGDRAATVMAAQLDLSPRPHQWVYLEQRQATLNDDHWLAGVGPGRVTTRLWKRVDGKRLAFERKGGGLRFRTGAFAVGRPQLHVRDLPTDPDALLARIRREVAGTGSVERRRQAMFTLIGIVLRDNILPPRVQAAMYQALPKIPGVRLQKGAVDAAGRHGVAFARVTPGDLGLRVRVEIILDLQTFHYLGERTVAANDATAPDGEWQVAKATVLSAAARTAAAIVNRPGQRS